MGLFLFVQIAIFGIILGAIYLLLNKFNRIKIQVFIKDFIIFSGLFLALFFIFSSFNINLPDWVISVFIIVAIIGGLRYRNK